MSVELKPCPMCGSQAEVRDPHGMDMWQVRCTDGYCGVNDPHNFDTPEDAIKAWNTRPVEDALTAENAALRAEVARLTGIIRGGGSCGLAISHGCRCPIYEQARALLAGKE